MADAEKYAQWIVANKDKKGTPEFETVAKAYKQAKADIEPQENGGFVKGAKNVGLGALKGASDIGATLLTPVDYALNKTGISDMTNDQRRESLKSFFDNNADTDSLAFKGGELGAGIAGTLGVGGALGAGLKLASKTPKALALAESLRTGGMAKDAGLANNVIGGAGSTAIGSLLLDPTAESGGVGAAVGGGLPVVGKAAPAVGGMIADAIGGLGTHTGGESLRTAARVGMEGGQAAKSFTDNMRGNVPMTDVLETAKSNLNQMRADKVAAYKSGMTDISKDKTVLDFKPIAEELRNQASVGSFKGKVINESTADTQSKLKSLIEDWGSSDPAEFHTPEGLDALKKAVGDVRESTPFGTPSRKVADSVYNSIKKEITSQAPEYAITMKGYQEASEQISEIEKALSLGNKASVDTAMRKLQSLTRNNVNTNYGNRLDLAKALEQQGGKDIMPALSGQALNNLTPRGFGVPVAGATALAGAATLNPAIIAALLAQSPRVMGETALKTGQMAKILKGGAKKITPANAALINALNGD